MFEEFREQANQALEEQTEEEAQEEQEGISGLLSKLNITQIKTTAKKFTPAQRAVIATLLFVVVCLFSFLCLLLTGSIAPPL